MLGTLRRANEQRQAVWPGAQQVSLLFRAVEFGGEAGELLNACKKLHRADTGMAGNTVDRTAIMQNIVDELADVIIATDLLAMDLNIDLYAAVRQKFNNTSDKIGVSVKL